jgi:hypothetical protein
VNPLTQVASLMDGIFKKTAAEKATKDMVGSPVSFT